MTFGRNFLPGPTGVHPDVLAAMQEPMFPHYGHRMTEVLEEIQPSLRAVFGTSRPVFAVTSSGTGLLEGAIRGAVRHRVLVVTSGYFGEYFARIAEHCGKDVVRVSVPLGRTLEADQLDQLLDGPRIDAVALVHSESSTGALAPLADLAAVVRKRPDVMLLVDGISSVGGLPIEMDRIGVDCIVTSSQKALAIPPGLAFGAVSERLEARARTIEDVGYYFNLARWTRMAAEHRVWETPALSQFMALVHQLRRVAAAGGWPARWDRHAAMAARCHAWAAGIPGVRLLAPEGRRSPTVSALALTDRDPAQVARALADQGYLVGQAVHPDQGPLIRIGHMGDLEPADLDRLLSALEPLLS
ncbi:MAG: alanine--glyoxylate aminotransferase family protein [Gemmatimonadetes bacterium]|nr:alanine--glyoxylate aminotransferase family protein [Gemmatimonadota bacterium]